MILSGKKGLVWFAQPRFNLEQNRHRNFQIKI